MKVEIIGDFRDYCDGCPNMKLEQVGLRADDTTFLKCVHDQICAQLMIRMQKYMTRFDHTAEEIKEMISEKVPTE